MTRSRSRASKTSEDSKEGEDMMIERMPAPLLTCAARDHTQVLMVMGTMEGESNGFGCFRSLGTTLSTL